MVRVGGHAALSGTAAELDAVEAMDDEVDSLRGAIVTYLAELGQHETSAEQSAEVTRLLAATDELEAIGDVVEQGLVRLGHRRIDERIDVSPSTVEVIGGLLDQVTANLEEAVAAVAEANREGVVALLDHRVPEVKRRREEAMTRQALRLTDQGPQRALAYTRQIELISEIYRIHTLTKRLLRRQLTDPIEVEGAFDLFVEDAASS